MNSIIRIMRTKKGMALPSVIVVSTLLLMMMVPLLNLSIQQLKISKSQSVIGYSYLASGSSTEIAMDLVKNYVQTKSYLSKYSSDTETYVEEVRKDIFNLVKAKLSTSIKVDNANSAKSELKNVYTVGYKPEGNKIRVTLGLVIGSTYKKGINTSTATDVYSQVVIEIENNKNYFRPAAINAIGDIYIKNSNAIINGDVKVVGTAPNKTSMFEQYTYGGIYAVGSGSLTINGSAFVRAFIRCGNTTNIAADNFTIDIKNNAIAQCIQVFGKKDYVLVRKDAYTFDDVEMNGLDSVIAINRNFFGLSKGLSAMDQHHDASSAIVNSAVIHHPDETSIVDAMKSKIIINGNVMINGGTFLIDPETGTLKYPSNPKNPNGDPQIEDASCAWDDIDEIATYKNYEIGGKNFHALNNKQDSWISEQYRNGRAFGYSNYFQVFPTDELKISTWFDKFKTNNEPFSISSTGYNTNNIKKIKGFCNYEIAANGKMYFMDINTLPVGSESDIDMADKTLLDQSKVGFENSLYYLKASERQNYITGPSNWDSLWNFDTGYKGYYDNVISWLENLKVPLLQITEDFVKREYKYSAGVIDNSLQIESSTGDSYFKYIGNELMKCDKGKTDRVITSAELPINETSGNYEVPTLDSSKYYIIVINDADPRTLVIKGTLNGIVYTTGKVIMSKGSILNGFIIAAGKGMGGTGSAIDNMPYTYINSDTDNNISELDNGNYAAVVFEEGATAATAPQVNFDFAKNGDQIDIEESLNILLSKFSDIDYFSTLENIFK